MTPHQASINGSTSGRLVSAPISTCEQPIDLANSLCNPQLQFQNAFAKVTENWSPQTLAASSNWPYSSRVVDATSLGSDPMYQVANHYLYSDSDIKARKVYPPTSSDFSHITTSFYQFDPAQPNIPISQMECQYGLLN
jgi:hypothetical protein